MGKDLPARRLGRETVAAQVRQDVGIGAGLARWLVMDKMHK